MSFQVALNREKVSHHIDMIWKSNCPAEPVFPYHVNLRDLCIAIPAQNITGRHPWYVNNNKKQIVLGKRESKDEDQE